MISKSLFFLSFLSAAWANGKGNFPQGLQGARPEKVRPSSFEDESILSSEFSRDYSDEEDEGSLHSVGEQELSKDTEEDINPILQEYKTLKARLSALYLQLFQASLRNQEKLKGELGAQIESLKAQIPEKDKETLEAWEKEEYNLQEEDSRILSFSDLS